MINWEAHRMRSDTVLCEIAMRDTYMGRQIKASCAGKNGTRLMLYAMWLMDEDDSYPGEYALSTTDSCDLLNLMDVAWIASGDVKEAGK